MKITGFTTIRPEMASTRTYEDFSKFLGTNPARLGIVSSLYDQYTATYLTESLMNIYTMEKDRKNAFQSINSFMVEWDIDVNFIKRVPFLSVPEGDGAQGTDIVVHFPENYYQKNDVFIIENSRQQLIVLSRPVRRSDADFELICKIQDSDYSATLDLSACQPGMNTRFLTNYQPELHEEGYTKYQSNTEKHRTFISMHRCDVSYSAKYAAMEDQFITIGKGDGKDDVTYKMNPAAKDCLDTFMLARNNSLLWGKTNVDKYGKAKIFDPETGQPIISGDGIIPQIERFAGKYIFTKLNMRVFETALQAMVAKSEKPTGNQYIFICNTAMWNDVQRVMSNWIRDYKTNGAFIYSKATNGYINLGATYNAYEFAGNTIAFKIDRSFDIEFPSPRRFGIFLDLTADGKTGRPALSMFTFKGLQIVHNWLTGPGGRDGKSGGEVSTPVAGAKLINWGYAGVGVFNPYRSFILMSEN